MGLEMVAVVAAAVLGAAGGSRGEARACVRISISLPHANLSPLTAKQGGGASEQRSTRGGKSREEKKKSGRLGGAQAQDSGLGALHTHKLTHKITYPRGLGTQLFSAASPNQVFNNNLTEKKTLVSSVGFEIAA